MSLTPETINAEAFIQAVEKLRQTFPYMTPGWFETCKNRLLDVEYIGTNEKGWRVYHVKNNPKFDSYKQSYRKVMLRGVLQRFCSCFFGSYGDVRRTRLCSHIGTSLLWEWYHEAIRKL